MCACRSLLIALRECQLFEERRGSNSPRVIKPRLSRSICRNTPIPSSQVTSPETSSSTWPKFCWTCCFKGLQTMIKQENRTIKYTSGQCRTCCPFIRQISQLVLMLESSGKEGKVRKRKRQPAAAQTLTIVDMDASGFVDKPEKVARRKPDLAKYMSEIADEDDDEDNEGVMLRFLTPALVTGLHQEAWGQKTLWSGA